MLALAFSLLALCALPAQAGYSYAVDLSLPGTQLAFNNLRANGYSVAFVRAYAPDGGGRVDYNAATNVKLAYAAGLGIEVYGTLSPTSSKAGYMQIDEALNALQSAGITVRSFWIQVTSPVNWSSNQNQNVNFIQSAIQRIRARGVRPGVYTSAYDWNQITNNFSGLGSDVMLWYWHVYGAGPSGESPADFNDFRAFGQWTSPMVKQFAQSESLYGFSSVNRDVFASNSVSETSAAAVIAARLQNKITVGLIGL